jgi:electron transfer flavoprotein alpha subunit
MAGIWVYAEHKDGKLKSTAAQLLTGARKLAETLGEEVVALLLGSGVEGMVAPLGPLGADKVLVADAQPLGEYLTEPYCHVLATLMKERQPSIFLGPASSIGKDLFPRVAARLQTGLASDCTEIGLTENKELKLKRPVYAGKAFIEVVIPSQPAMASIRPNTLTPKPADSSKTASIEKISVSIPPEAFRVKLKEVVKGKSEKVDLTEANIIVSGGRAMQSSDNYKMLWDLASAFGEGATVGASRAAVDSSYASHDMQVGQTGKVVNPNLYIACGISGAIQHLAGMRTSKVIVAINKDPDAPIFQKADFGIVGDLFKIVPALVEEIKRIKAHD